MRTLKPLFLLLLLQCLYLQSDAQGVPDWDWAKNYLAKATMKKIATDASGNVYTFGNFQVFEMGPFNYVWSDGNEDLFIAKHDKNGVPSWVKRIDGQVTAGDMTIDAAGNIYVTGNYAGNTNFYTLGGNITLTTPSYQRDVFVAKYNSSGNAIWAKRAGGSEYDMGNAIAVDASGNVFVAGKIEASAGPAVFGSFNLTCSGITDIFLAKFDSNGDVVHAVNYGSGGPDEATGIALDASGNVFVTGVFHVSAAFGSTTLTSMGHEDVFLAKYSNAGVNLWAKSSGTIVKEFGGSVATDAQGNAYVSGPFDGGESFTIGSTVIQGSTSTTSYIAKYDPAGNISWAKGINKTGDLQVKALVTNSKSEVYLTGFSSGVFQFAGKQISSSSYNICILKYDNAGNEIWAEQVLSTGSDISSSIALNSNGEIHICGNMGGAPAKFGSITISAFSNANPDIFLAKMKPEPVSVTDTKKAAEQYTIYPNPTTGILYNNINMQHYDKLNVTDVTGKSVYNSILSQKINLSHLANGVYILQFSGKAGTFEKKTVINK